MALRGICSRASRSAREGRPPTPPDSPPPHCFARRFKPASIRRRMASDLVTLATAAHPSIAATSAGKLLVLHFHELDIRVTRFFCR